MLHLPTIVEAAESSPSAAKVAAQTIRKFLSKENYPRPHVQYNAIMLIRILADNPGASFTRNFDQKFTNTVKELLRNGKDASVQQIMRETLQALYMEKAYDTNLQTLFQMWSKESGVNISQVARTGGGQGGGSSRHRGQQQMPGMVPDQSQQRAMQLPPPVELAARIEEAKTSAKLLQQLVQSTAPSELQDNDLIKEFAERCQNAQRSMQVFMNTSNPSPDDDTMQTLIETSEQLSLAASKHQRAVLQARRSGHTASPPPVPPPNGAGAPPQLPPIGGAAAGGNTGYSSPNAAPSSTFTPSATHDLQSYSPPPAPPSVLRKALNRRSMGGDSNAVPPSLKPAGPPTGPPPTVSKMSVDTSDDPFGDEHHVYQPPAARSGPSASRTQNRSSLEPVSASSYEDDDIYRGPYGGGSTVANVSARPPAPRAPQESWRREDAGSPQSYNPGYQSTPSYIKRQESSGENFTMRGAATDPVDGPAAGTGTIAEERVQESAGRYGRVSPEEGRDGRQASLQGDVSPVESRYNPPSSTAGTGYRY